MFLSDFFLLNVYPCIRFRMSFFCYPGSAPIFFTGVSLEPELEPEQEPELRQRCCKTRSKSCPKFGWLRNPSATTTKKCRSSAPGLLSSPMFGRFRLRVLQRLQLQLQTDSSRKETQKIPKNNSQVHCNILNCLNLIAWVRTLHP